MIITYKNKLSKRPILRDISKSTQQQTPSIPQIPSSWLNAATLTIRKNFLIDKKQP
jgi:hypothetical protein